MERTILSAATLLVIPKVRLSDFGSLYLSIYKEFGDDSKTKVVALCVSFPESTTASDCSAAKSPENSQHGSAGDGFPGCASTREVKQQWVGGRPRHCKDAQGPHKEDRIRREEDRSQRQKGQDLQLQGRLNSGCIPILKGVDSKKFIQRPFPEETSPKPIPKKFRMPELPKYNGTSDPNEHVTPYTCTVRGNDVKGDEIEYVLLKKFGKTLSKGAMMWYHNLAPNSIDSFAMLADSFIKANAGAIKVATRKSDVFKIKQKENEMMREFVSRFQIEGMELPPVSNDWAIQAFTQGLNEQSSVASKQLKQNLVEYPTVTWYTGPTKAPYLSEYNFIVDVLDIAFAISKSKTPSGQDLYNQILHKGTTT
ncbi:uncharacterized protein [Nicotiana sylvestris]|uniref:uncharacterized protein n=1 Tax=Nicotiana sylvestris TaxID=4096 RepID=UPI00388CBA9F